MRRLHSPERVRKCRLFLYNEMLSNHEENFSCNSFPFTEKLVGEYVYKRNFIANLTIVSICAVISAPQQLPRSLSNFYSKGVRFFEMIEIFFITSKPLSSKNMFIILFLLLRFI